MEKFEPKTFFDLTQFRHQDLFLETLPVWEALNKIFPYLKSTTLGEIQIEIPPGVTLIHPELISIGIGTTIQPGAYLEGPCLIGSHCEVRHGSYIRPGVITGDHCILGHASELKHTILLDHARAPHFNYVGDSILGNDVNLGAGVICANFRLDQKEVSVRVESSNIKTNLRKFGAIIGDKSQLGCNSVVNPGILLRKKTFCRPCTNLQRSNVKYGPVKNVNKSAQTRPISC